jgi:short-subunit dehydrogenase
MLQGKTVLITGASSGIGQACAERFAESGARLLLLARRRERLEQLAAQLQQHYGTSTHCLVCDVRHRHAVQHVGNAHNAGYSSNCRSRRLVYPSPAMMMWSSTGISSSFPALTN